MPCPNETVASLHFPHLKGIGSPTSSISKSILLKTPIFSKNDFNYSKAKIFLETCFENGLKKVIFSSTAAVYGNPKENKVIESDELNPLSPYADSKLMIEN